MDLNSSSKISNETIKENEKKVYEKSFDRLANLQALIKKESSLKELCKIFIIILILFKFYSYKNKRRNF